MDSKRIIDLTLDIFKKLFEEIIIVTNNKGDFIGFKGVKIVEDLVENCGPLGGIYTGLQAMRREHGFFVACDMPFLDSDVIWSQVGAFGLADLDAVVPRWNGNIEPIHAIYGKTCLPAIGGCIEKGKRKIIAFYDDVRLRYWDLDPPEKWRRYFHNINTEAELRSLGDVAEA